MKGVKCTLNNNYRVHRSTDVISFVLLSYRCIPYLLLTKSIQFFFIDTEGNGLIFEKNIECHKIVISFIVSRKKLEGFCELLIQLDTARTTQFSARE